MLSSSSIKALSEKGSISYIRRDKKDMRHIMSKTLQLPESEPSAVAGRDCACEVEVKTLIMKKAGR